MTSGPAAMVRPWPYQFLREKKWRRFDSNRRMCYSIDNRAGYRMASPSGLP